MTIKSKLGPRFQMGSCDQGAFQKKRARQQQAQQLIELQQRSKHNVRN